MESRLFKTSGIQEHRRTVAHWHPDPPAGSGGSYTGYSPPSAAGAISRKLVQGVGFVYVYKGRYFDSYSEAKAYKDAAYVPIAVASGPATYSPQLGYYYTASGKKIINKFYVRDPMTGVPIMINAAVKL